MTCQSVRCEMPGEVRGECSDCEGEIVRCGDCHHRYSKLKICRFCTGGGVYAVPRPVAGHVDEERDLDANGWLSNAIRILEENR